MYCSFGNVGVIGGWPGRWPFTWDVIRKCIQCKMFKRDRVLSIVMKIVLFYFGFCDVCKLPRTVVYVLLHDCVNVRVCNLHRQHQTGHIGSYKLSALFIYDRCLLLSHSVLWVLNTVPIRNSYTYHLSHRNAN